MKVKQWIALNKNGITKTRKTKPDLDWNEIALQVVFEIPDELFQRPTIEARIVVKDVPNTAYNAELILNTKELIEQQMGGKINMTVVAEEQEEL